MLSREIARCQIDDRIAAAARARTANAAGTTRRAARPTRVLRIGSGFLAAITAAVHHGRAPEIRTAN